MIMQKAFEHYVSVGLIVILPKVVVVVYAFEPMVKFGNSKGALSRRFLCVLVKIAQIFNKFPFV